MIKAPGARDESPRAPKHKKSLILGPECVVTMLSRQAQDRTLKGDKSDRENKTTLRATVDGVTEEGCPVR